MSCILAKIANTAYFLLQIADFGQSKLQNITTRTFTSHSDHGGALGTVTHISPEMLCPPDEKYNRPTEKSDVWRYASSNIYMD